MLSEERIEELWVSINKGKFMCAGFNTFARAIEAECAKVPEEMLQYVRSYWNPHKGLTATQLAHNNTISDLIEGLEKIMLAPAPQPAPKAEKQEPVKDEPVTTWSGPGWNETKQLLAELDHLPIGTDLYTRPQPDLTAEVEFMQGKYEEMLEEWLPQKQRIAELEAQDTEMCDVHAQLLVEHGKAKLHIAALEEAAREAREAFEQHDGNYKLSKASGAVVEAAIAKLNAVLGK